MIDIFLFNKNHQPERWTNHSNTIAWKEQTCSWYTSIVSLSSISRSFGVSSSFIRLPSNRNLEKLTNESIAFFPNLNSLPQTTNGHSYRTMEWMKILHKASIRSYLVVQHRISSICPLMSSFLPWSELHLKTKFVRQKNPKSMTYYCLDQQL